MVRRPNIERQRRRSFTNARRRALARLREGLNLRWDACRISAANPRTVAVRLTIVTYAEVAVSAATITSNLCATFSTGLFREIVRET